MLVKLRGSAGQNRYIRVDLSRVEEVDVWPEKGKGTIRISPDKDGKGGLHIDTTPEEAQRVADAIRKLEG
jgi:hypothetical protein